MIWKKKNNILIAPFQLRFGAFYFPKVKFSYCIEISSYKSCIIV
nr:MAG TPA: hypothetical protein [Caudoviricetes sp.]DAL38206.1 MAG TPA_asm: hypothetical protein [Bacteriophage sp.]DAP86584.1 MAG TPA: hypothetical protein [Caudoviricetes sp.]